MTKRNFAVIDGCIVLNCAIGKDDIQVTTETCPFCGRRHFHGTGNVNWAKNVQVVDGIRTLGHRVRHCILKDVTITLGDGTEVCNERGYYLGIGHQVPR